MYFNTNIYTITKVLEKGDLASESLSVKKPVSK